jgi:DNA-binding transcriptional LysR family regulator
MDLKKIHYVLAVSEQKSISKAAKKLYISQPALSKYIITVEKELGIRLFDRKTTPIKLTYAGEKYIKAARQILSIEKKTDDIIRDIKNEKKSKITIGVPMFKGARLLPNILKRYLYDYPEVEVKVFEDTSYNLEKITVEGKVDFSLVWLPINSSELEKEELFTQNLILAVPSGYIFSNGKSVEAYKLENDLNLSDCEKEPFILFTKGQNLRYFTDCMFIDEGFTPNCILETHNIETAYNMVVAGLGLSILYDSDFQNSRSRKDSAIFFPINSKYHSSMGVAYQKGKYLNKASINFIQTVKELYCKSN